MKVFMVIAVFNNRAHTLNCLSLLSQQSFSNFKVILVDDGSSDGTRAAVKSMYPETTIIEGDGNWWWSRSMNAGFKAAMDQQADVVITLNNDVIIGRNCLELLISRHKQHPGAIIGCLNTINREDRYIFFSGVKRVNWLNAKEIKYHSAFTKVNQPMSGLHASVCLNGRGTLIPRSVFEQIGYYDDKHFPQYAADFDFTLRAVEKGFPVFIDWENEVASVIENTGKGRTFIRQKTGSYLASFFNQHSSNSLRMWFHYYRRHAGWAFFIGFPLQILKLVYAYYRKRNVLEELK
ncbi:MAG: glycosyltransferase family 2 protein [Carboxylicivirga sp.]|nr:glycosyltransferase family 2 protein [Carboxylicivirga sp.]